MKAFVDLKELPEDHRIAMIAHAAEAGHIVGFFVNDDVTADRYLAKLGTRVRVIERKSDVPFAGVVFIKIGPIPH